MFSRTRADVLRTRDLLTLDEPPVWRRGQFRRSPDRVVRLAEIFTASPIAAVRFIGALTRSVDTIRCRST